MIVKLEGILFYVEKRDGLYVPQFKSEEWWLSRVASQSRNLHPTTVPGLFGRTEDVGHGSIQEFTQYVFQIEDFSNTALRQITRHRIGVAYNVMSGRHVRNKVYICPPSMDEHYEIFKNALASSSKHVSQLLNLGVPLEDARYLEPMASAVNFYFALNGRSFRHLMELRMTREAQWEVRELATKIHAIVKRINPILARPVKPKFKFEDWKRIAEGFFHYYKMRSDYYVEHKEEKKADEAILVKLEKYVNERSKPEYVTGEVDNG